MNWNRLMKKSIQLMTTSCLVCVVKNSAEATEFQLPLDAFENGEISMNPSSAITLVEQIDNNFSNPVSSKRRSESSLFTRLGDHDAGYALTDNITDGASNTPDTISTAQVKLDTLSNTSLTPTRISSVDSIRDGVQSMNGLTSFTISTAAPNVSSGTITIIGRDKSPLFKYNFYKFVPPTK